MTLNGRLRLASAMHMAASAATALDAQAQARAKVAEFQVWERSVKPSGLYPRELGGVLGILQQDADAFLKGSESDDEVAEIERLISERNQARADKNWAAADAARNRLTEMGIVLEDSADQTTWRRA